MRLRTSPAAFMKFPFTRRPRNRSAVTCSVRMSTAPFPAKERAGFGSGSGRSTPVTS